MAHVRDRPCTAGNAFMERNNRVAYLPHGRTAVGRTVLTDIIDITSPKHDRQHEQTGRPCDHHSQQEPLIGFHCGVPACSLSRYAMRGDGRPSPTPVWLASM